jgi:DMSO/TMAO reductase YedYZ molybdopterin-dependent catalytic subunit
VYSGTITPSGLAILSSCGPELKVWHVRLSAVTLNAISPISRGFLGRGQTVEEASLLPPGQYVTRDFPVLSAGPTPHSALDQWNFTIRGQVHARVSWRGEQFMAIPSVSPTVDIHCVTRWTKLGTRWGGVSVETVLDAVNTEAPYVTARSDGAATRPTSRWKT